jgi:hypothetical protein
VIVTAETNSTGSATLAGVWQPGRGWPLVGSISKGRLSTA